MRAVVLKDFGVGPVVGEVPLPEPGPGEVRVRIKAASVNGFDLSVVGGYARAYMEHRFPVVVGKDFAGVVDSVGEGVSGLTPGDRVFGVVMKPVIEDGSFGEYVTVSSDYLARMPESIDDTTAAALGLAGAAAIAVLDAAAVEEGDTVLVSGATGGVGTYVVQLAATRGVHVVATAQPGEEAKHVRRIGAEHAVDHTGDLAAQVSEIAPDGVDVLIHLAGDAIPLLDLVKPGGRVASTLGVGPDQAGDRGLTVTPIMANPVRDVLERLAAEVAEGRLHVHVQRTYRLDEAQQAFTDFATGTLGKLVITID